MKDFRGLKVWQKAHQLTLDIYKATVNFPAAEQFGLTSQMRRSAASIPANIAEGCGRDSDLDFARFLQIALGSSSELEYHIVLARDLGLLRPSDERRLSDQVIEVKRMLASLVRKLRADR